MSRLIPIYQLRRGNVPGFMKTPATVPEAAPMTWQSKHWDWGSNATEVPEAAPMTWQSNQWEWN